VPFVVVPPNCISPGLQVSVALDGTELSQKTTESAVSVNESLTSAGLIKPLELLGKIVAI
tara:strand:+ start:5227 stop:5406 length:180 start_codon:yes stop_codon:yes gene_type:complete